jgi:hypothetical protein
VAFVEDEHHTPIAQRLQALLVVAAIRTIQRQARPSTGCSISGTTVSVTNASGTCSLTAAQAGDTNYNLATSAAFLVTLNKATLTITPDGGKGKVFAVAEKFDVVLRALTGHSLKDEAQLWRYHKELRDARNTLVHKGLAMVGTSRVDARKARELVGGAEKIIKWVELLLPEAKRRARTEAIGPFTRRLASQATQVARLKIQADAQNRGPIRVFRADKPAGTEGDT